jgi:hypothetical protein
VTLIKRYKSLVLFLLGIVFAFFLFQWIFLRDFLIGLNTFGYLGGFIAGILFVSSFTVGIAVLIISILAQNLHPLFLALIVGLGAVFGDLIVLRLVKNSLKDELDDIYKLLDKKQLIKKILRKKYLKWIAPFLGVFLIASPFPDEIGIMLFGMSKIKESHFVVISFLLNTFGIYLLIRLLL